MIPVFSRPLATTGNSFPLALHIKGCHPALSGQRLAPFTVGNALVSAGQAELRAREFTPTAGLAGLAGLVA
jgi:hypothetical protein